MLTSLPIVINFFLSSSFYWGRRLQAAKQRQTKKKTSRGSQMNPIKEVRQAHLSTKAEELRRRISVTGLTLTEMLWSTTDLDSQRQKFPSGFFSLDIVLKKSINFQPTPLVSIFKSIKKQAFHWKKSQSFFLCCGWTRHLCSCLIINSNGSKKLSAFEPTAPPNQML